MKKELLKKEEKNELPEEVAKNQPERILGGKVLEGRDLETGEIIKIEDDGRDYKAEIEKIPEEERVQQVEMFNPATGVKELVTIDRRGMFDEKLGMILSDKNSTADEKLSSVSLWLFENGRESGAFIIDVLQAKGQFLKGAHEFKSQVRFDFTVFMETFCSYLEGNAQMKLNYLIPGKDAIELEKESFEYLKSNKDRKATLSEFILENTPSDKYSIFYAIFIEQAIRDVSEARLIRQRIMEIAEKREAEQGKGVYLDKGGKATNKL